MEQAASDQDLIERIATQDQTAVSVLFARHQVRVYRFILRMTRNEAIAEELTNEVFLDVWRQAARYEGRSSVTTWMLAIAHNKTVSVLRKKTEDTLDEQTANTLTDVSDAPDVTAQKQNKAMIMRDCMEHLSVEHKQVIDLVYYHEKSVREVSEILGIPQNTVKTRMFYARKQLSELLLEAGIDRGWP